MHDDDTSPELVVRYAWGTLATMILWMPALTLLFIKAGVATKPLMIFLQGLGWLSTVVFFANPVRLTVNGPRLTAKWAWGREVVWSLQDLSERLPRPFVVFALNADQIVSSPRARVLELPHYVEQPWVSSAAGPQQPAQDPIVW